MSSELLGYKLNNGETHTRADGTTLSDAYFLPFAIEADRLKKHATVQIGLWKDRTTFESVLAGGTTRPIYTFPIEISGADFYTFVPDFTSVGDHLATYLADHNPSNIENLDFSKFTRETTGNGITLPAIAITTGLAILTGMAYYLANNSNILLALLR